MSMPIDILGNAKASITAKPIKPKVDNHYATFNNTQIEFRGETKTLSEIFVAITGETGISKNTDVAIYFVRIYETLTKLKAEAEASKKGKQ
jgi:hypothetical protein